MENFFEILRHTPWWVYLLFAYILYVGITAMKLRSVPVFQLFIVPAIFTILSIHTLVGRIGDHFLYIIPWGIAAAIGIAIGWIEMKRLNIIVDRRNRLLKIPGSAFTLILLLLFFGCKYYYGFMSATAPERAKEIQFVIFILLITGMGTGVMWVRGFGYFSKYVKSHSVEVIK
ncbi:MAG TPA: DUF6622 family protein [Thermodesulfobacteriota bacterium]|nr:DUF6622 family protein [Thermodesulfobacteriota bacterium]